MELDLVQLERLIDLCLWEDIGPGDLTTRVLIEPKAVARGLFVSREPGVVAGLPVAAMVFRRLSGNVIFKSRVSDGERVDKGGILAEVEGEAGPVLCGERLALNFLQRLSGIATATARLTKLTEGYRARIVDTRKTTPGLRMLEKYAVRAGGGVNHRFGLFDGVLIKDNHLALAGGIGTAVKEAKKKVPYTMRVEVEVENLEGVQEALDAGADIILLDNMSLEDMARAVKMTGGQALVEASGGINEKNVREVAATGVDFISVGALTHHVRSLDIGLDFSL